MKPSLYQPKIAEKIFELTKTGKYNIEAICMRVGISPATYFNWQKAFPDFKAGLQAARELKHDALKEMAISGLAKLLDTHTVEETTTEYVSDEAGKPVVRSKKVTQKTFMPNPTAIIFTLKNRDAENWSDKRQLELSAGTNNPLERMNREELEVEKQRLLGILHSDSELD